MKRLINTRVGALLFCALSASTVWGQQTYNEMEQLTVNENVTTVITASEPIRLVDISTDKIVGDKPIENTIRLKPKEGGHEDGAVLAIDSDGDGQLDTMVTVQDDGTGSVSIDVDGNNR